MDRNEAIEHLKVVLKTCDVQDEEAVEMAIAALDDKDINVPTKWIPVSEKLPEEKINPNTQDFEEVLCSTTFGDVRAYKFGTPLGWEKPHFWRGLNVMDEYVLAWMEKPKPWKGEQDGKA